MKSWLRKLLTIVIPGLLLGANFARDPAWYKDRVKFISELGNNPNDAEMRRLGVLVGIGFEREKMDAEQKEIFQLAQAKLLSLPNHADYFHSMIQKVTEAEASGTGGYHSTERPWLYQSIQQLPSPEVVRVLGELLFDERGRDDSEDPVQDVDRNLANCRYASRALAALIDKPPYDPKLHPVSDSALDAWKLWYQQVKAGTRTFRFKGSPVLYGINGPVTEPVGPGGGMDHSSSANTALGTSEVGSLSGTTTSFPWAKWITVAAGLLAVIGASLAFGKKRKTR